MRRSRNVLLGSLSALVLLLSCVDGDQAIAPASGGTVRIPLAAQFAASAADASARPINRIRAVARAVPGDEVLGEATVSVDPAADVWSVPLEIRVEGLLAEVVVDLLLINVDAAGVETIEYSGRVGPLTVRPGSDAPAIDVPVVRGPPGNLGVTAIDITNATPALVEGASRTLQASVTNPGGGTPTVFWTSLSPTNLSFNGAIASALLPGNATVVATAGPVSDTATIQIVQRPTSVTVTPGSTQLDIGSEVVFTGNVLDPRGQTIAGQAVLWRSLDPTVLEALTNGRFRAIGTGSGRAEARAAADTTLKGVGTARVLRRAVDIAVTKSTPTTLALVGDAVVFTVAAANQSDIEAVGVRLRDQLPSGLTLESTQASAGTFDAATGTWTVGTLAAGARATLELRTRVSSGSSGSMITNTAEKLASDDQTDSNAGNDRASASFSIGERIADLTLQKTASRATILEGDTVTFTVTVTNTGNAAVANLAVADSLPAGLGIVSDGATRGAFERTLRSWAVGTLGAGESAQLTIQVRALSGSGATTQTNVARILSWDGPRDPNTVNNRAVAAVTVQANNQADVAVTKTVANGSLLEGDTATFTVKVKNLGPLTSTGVEVKDSLPTGLAYVSAAPLRGTFSANTMIWTVGTLVMGDSALMTVRAVVNTGTTGQTLPNTARYLASGPVADGVPGNNVATASVTVVPRATNLEVVKVASVANPIENTAVSFTVTATNLGPYDITNLRIKDKLPAGLTLDSIRTATGTVVGDTIWSIPALAVSTSATMQVYVRVNDLTGGTTIVNQASRLSMDQGDPVPGNDVGTASLAVRKRNLDLEVRKTASVAQPAVLSAFSYKVVVKNRGPGTATSIQVADTLPTLLTTDSVRTSTGTFASSSWSIPTLVQGDSAIMTVYVRVPQAASAQTITNRARRVAQAQSDTNAVNDTSTVSQSVPVNNPPVVTISAPPNQAVFDPGDTITFVATATDQEDGTLTNSIVWTSNVSGAMGTGGSVTRSNLAPGPHLVIATVTDSNNNVSADTVPIVIAIVTTPTTLNVPFGGTASMPISLSAPAPSGGLLLTITSADTTKVRPVTSSVTIPAGQLSANAQLSGVLPGTATVTASTQGFGSSTTSVSVTASLNIVQGSITFPQGQTSPTFTVRLESQGVQIAAPSGGVVVTLTATNPQCVTVPASVTIPAGQVSVNATATYGGTTTVPCNTLVTASATSITSDAFTVYVNTPPAMTVYTYPVGSGLVTSASVQLDYSQHGGVTVRVSSLNPAVALVAPNGTTAGTAFVDFPLTNGTGSFSYYIQGVEGATGAVPIQATAPGFLQDTTSVVVEQPAVTLAGLGTSYTSLNTDQQFYAYVGISDIYYGGVNQQNIRTGGTPLTVTISSSDTTKGALVKTAGTDDTVTVTIPVGSYNSPTSVAAGGVALDFRAAGTTTVRASIPGFIQRPNATVNVAVTAPGITPYDTEVGGGLQIQSQAYLEASGHGGVTVSLVSADPSVMLLSPNATTAGTPTLNVVVPNGSTTVNFYLQGLETAVQQVQSVQTKLRITAPGFVSDSATITVSRPYVAINGLNTTFTSFDADQQFYAAVGLSDIYYGGVNPQAVRAGGPTLTVTFASSDSSKARLVSTARSGDTVTAQIAPGQYYTPFTVAAGGVALDPRTGGSTTVTAAVPGLLQRPAATVAVTVSAPAIQASQTTVGAGLQQNTSAYLGTSNHGGVTVSLVSSNPSVALLSPNATTPGTATLDVVVPNGQSSASYYVQGIAGTTGSSIVTVSAPGMTSDTASASIVQPYVTLYGLSTSTTTLSPNQAFYAAVGLSDIYYGGVSGQNVRAGGSPLTVTINSDNQGVGQLQTTGGTSGTATVTIPVGQYISPQTVVAGGVAFDPYGAGTTNVSGSVPGFLQRPGAIVAVTVTSPGITMSSLTVGSGLMAQGNVNLGASSHGGVTLRIRSSSGAIAKVSANNTTAGADSVDIVVANGTSSVQFWVHGMEGQTGTVQFTASAAGFTDGSAAQTIVQPGVVVLSLPTSIAVASADRLFNVYVGTPSGSSVNGQVRRAGAAPLVATVTSSQAAVGTLVTSAGAGASRTVNIAAGQSQSPGSVGAGGVAFDPLTTGSTTVNATIPGFISQPNATVNVTVTP
jgi:uncharacterized repeat protein (TIGR01451 family)